MFARSLIVLGSLLSACGGASRAPELPLRTPCAVDDDGCRAERLGDVAFGGLRLGITRAELEALLGPPSEVGESEEMAATGLFVRELGWPEAGVRASVAATAAGQLEHLDGFTVMAPFAGKTSKGVGIGSAEAAVLAAYAEAIDGQATAPGERVVAGSLFGGAIFDLSGGVVVSVFVGAAAE